MVQKTTNSKLKHPNMHWGGLTDIGKVRQENQDAFVVEPEMGLFVVSDGMGGAQGGALASKVVISVLPRIIEKKIAELKKPTAEAVRRSMRDAIMELSRQVYEKSVNQIGLKGMGATVVLALIRGRWAHIAHLGDSRAYLLRNGQLTRITEDHSVIAILLRRGEITPEEAKFHPAKSQLTRVVGMEGEAYPDVYTIALKKGDRLLLCTDGLTGMISDTKIETILKKHSDPKQACRSLIDAANQAGGSDNITAIVADWR
jgi:protein phosphatase